MTLTVGKTVAEQRAFRAEVIASNFRQWIPVRTRFCGGAPGGTAAYAIPSQTRLGLYHIANLDRCGCFDSRRRAGACKHRRAIRIVLAQHNLRPEERTASRRNGHVTPEVYAF
jgi:hypothetical protein